MINLINGQITTDSLGPLSHLGEGVFETFKVSKRCRANHLVCLGLDRHYKRLSESSELLNYTFPTYKEMVSGLALACARYEWSELKVRIRLIALPHDWILSLIPWSQQPVLSSPVKLRSVNMIRALPNIKSCSALPSVLARKKALELNGDEALLVDDQGLVTEGAWSNFVWITRDSRIVSPLSNCLKGITLGYAEEIATSLNLKFSYEDHPLSYIVDNALGAFLTQSTTGVLEVKELDGRTFNEPNVSKVISKISEAYQNLASSAQFRV